LNLVVDVYNQDTVGDVEERKEDEDASTDLRLEMQGYRT
jgi:hypothetical protein